MSKHYAIPILIIKPANDIFTTMSSVLKNHTHGIKWEADFAEWLTMTSFASLLHTKRTKYAIDSSFKTEKNRYSSILHYTIFNSMRLS